MSTPRPELVGLLLEGRYELRHVLGAGGFATVYLALDRRLHEREVAIKVLHPEHLTSADQVVRFAREIKVAARIGAGCETGLLRAGQELGEHSPPGELVAGHLRGQRSSTSGTISLVVRP